MHTDHCYAKEGDLLCHKEESEGHIHDDDCYEEVTVETASASDIERKLICGEKEKKGHAHTEDCYAKGGEIICGQKSQNEEKITEKEETIPEEEEQLPAVEEAVEELVAVQNSAWEENAVEVSDAAEFMEAVEHINTASGGTFTIALKDDINLAGYDCAFKKNITTILGAGHTISGGNNRTLGVEGTATLNLGTDGDGEELILDGNDKTSGGPLIVLSGAAKLNIYEGTVLQNNHPLGNAGGIQMEEGSNDVVANMYGGIIDHCSDTFNAVSGGLLIGSGTFYMRGGEISNCSGGYGGGVYVGENAEFVMSGESEIHDCTASAYGGGVCGSQGTIRILSGTVEENEAPYGAGVAALFMKTGFWTSHELELKNAEIKNNTASAYGGALFMYNSNMPSGEKVEGCIITGNKAQVGGGIILMNNSSMDLSASGNKICNNTATVGGSDIFLNTSEDTMKLCDPEEIDETYRESGEKIDGWYIDDPLYVPSKDAEAVDISGTQKGELALVASYKVQDKADVTYDLDGGTAAEGVSYDKESVNVGTAVTIKKAPVKDGYTFEGWSDGTNLYQSEEQITIDKNIALKAVWSRNTDNSGDNTNSGNNPDTGNGSNAGNDSGSGNGSNAGNNASSGSGSSADNGSGTGGNNAGNNNTNSGNNSNSGSTGSSGSSRDHGSSSSQSWKYLSDRENHWNYQKNGTILKDCWAYLRNPYASQTQQEYAWFRFDKNGDMLYGWYRDEKTGDWYILHEQSDGVLGMMMTGWYKDNQDGRWYYLNPSDGKMLTGWQKIGADWYYLNAYAPQQTWSYDGTAWKFNGSSERPYGSLYVNEMTPDGYYVDEQGKLVQ